MSTGFPDFDLPVAPSPGAPPADPLWACTDPDFLAGLTQTVAVEFNANASGAATEASGGAPEDWQPVAGLEAVPCRIADRTSKVAYAARKPGVVAYLRLLFGRDMVVDLRYRFVHADPCAGTRYFHVDGKSRAERDTASFHHTVVDCLEFAL
jgi:hypothetical protein